MKKIIALTLALLMSFSCFSIISFAEETQKTTEHLTEVPEGYIGVYTVEDLYCVRNDLTANYILMSDIDLSESTAEGGDWNYGGRGWNPIGSDDKYSSLEFSGIFDGNNYSVLGMNIYIESNLPSGTDDIYLGLFSKVSGTVKNLTVDGNISLKTKGYGFNTFAGGITAYLYKGKIENCINKVKISVSNNNTEGAFFLFVGGITGSGVYGEIERCCNIADLYAYVYGKSNYSGYSIQYANVGGIVGCSYDVDRESYFNYTNVSCCFNSGDISADDHEGYYSDACGIGESKNKNCYNTGKIEAGRIPEGIGGASENCYNIGFVEVYPISSTATKCYYLEGVGRYQTDGTTSLTETQMKLESMYSGWDFDTIWTMEGREDYPYPELRDVPLVLPEDLLHKHEYTSEVTKEATHLEEGETTYTCECGDSYTEPVAKLEDHTYTSEVTKKATHLEEGETTYTCACGDSYTEPVAKLEAHTYKAVITEPTCTERGYTTYICACGDTYVGDYVGTKAHSYTSVVTRPATHLSEGVRTYTCSDCGDSYQEAIAKTKEHSYFVLNIVEPTCETEGYTTYMCECGHTYNGDKKASTGHNYNGDTCVDCGESKIDNCSCNCHKGGFSGFIWKILRFFYKLFGMNKTCSCGVAHY